MEIKTRLANRANYGAQRSLEAIKYLVIHYTGNDGDTDENNGNYFANNAIKTSAHYFVDDDSATLSVPESFIAYHCGTEKKYIHPDCRNSNSIGIEICDDVRNGKVYPSAATIANVLELTKQLMAEYGIPPENVIRHYDVTGKLCPAYWCGSAEKDALWRSEFWDKLTEKENDTMDKKKLDNTPDGYAVEAVAKATARGILLGDDKGNLMLHSPLTRQDFLVMADRMGLMD